MNHSKNTTSCLPSVLDKTTERVAFIFNGSKRLRPNIHHYRTLTLIEVVIALFMFAILMAGALTAVLQTRRHAENNVGAAVARSVAQGIIEQARLEGPTIRQDGAEWLPLRFIGRDANNFAAISQRSIPIESDPDEWTPVGALTDPNDPDSTVLGVLLDAQQRDASGNIIRPARYMNMEVNFRITENNAPQRYLAVSMRYRWQSPVNRADGSTPDWIVREIHTAIAFTSTF